jgi:hypothetical protein
MPSLRSLLSDIAPPSNAERKVFYVYDTDFGRPNNSGGALCSWTVPDGVTSVTFELWGAGGSGSGGNCMQAVRSPGSGGYAIRTVETQAGCVYTICAGGSSCGCCCSCVSINGCATYVSGSGIATTCALGGDGGCANCYILNNTLFISSCVKPRSGNSGDLSLSSTMNNVSYRGCWWRITEMPSGAPKIGNAGVAPDFTCSFCRNGDERGIAMFPGGAGISGTACNCVKGGGTGAAGMVKVTYS